MGEEFRIDRRHRWRPAHGLGERHGLVAGQPQIGSPLRVGAEETAKAPFPIRDEKGRLAALDMTLKGVEVIAMTDRPIIRGPILAYPALHNGLLYVRSDEELMCVDLRREVE